MSADNALIIEVTPPGSGLALDLGGGQGALQQPLEDLGYCYISIDIQCLKKNGNTVLGDVHVQPFKNESFDLVVSKDTLEHFLQPWKAVEEVHRILKPGGLFIIWVPFMHPFHGDDYYRYSPLGLKHLLGDFEIILFESPLWVFTVVGLAFIQALKQLHLGFMEWPVKKACYWLDRRFTRHQKRPGSFAAGYRLIAQKRIKTQR